MATQQRAPPRSSASSSTKQLYLLAYNFVSGLLWLVILGRVVILYPRAGQRAVWENTSNFAKWTQTLAAVEVVNSALGTVRAPLFTTLMQVASRFLLVWGIGHVFPATTSASPAYSSMLLAWSVTEVVRYFYFAQSLGGSVPLISPFLSWARYNLFFVLYPLGISSECYLVWRATGPAETLYGPLAAYMLYGILAVYVPGSYILFTHMMRQRRRIMRSKQRAE